MSPIRCYFEDGAEAKLRHVVVDAILEREGQILLVKRAEFLNEAGKWALPGGYLDRDETLAEAVVREALEETGYQVSQPKPFAVRDQAARGDDRQNVSHVFVCQVGERVAEPDAESSAVKWFALTDLPPTAQIAFDHEEILCSFKEQFFPDR